MARQRYTSTSPTFSNDFMYNAPWELAMKALEFNDKQVEEVFGSAQVIDGAIDSSVNYLDADRELVNQEKEKISSKVNAAVESLQKDKTQWRKVMPTIKNIGKELQSNLRTGTLSKVQGSYNAYQNLLKENAELAKTDPQTVNQVAAKYLSEWKKKNPNGSLGGIFQGGPIYGRRSLYDKKYQDIIKNFKANASTTFEGMYMVDNKWISEADVESAALNMAMSDPEFAGYIRQQQWMGDQSYSSPIQVYTDNKTGQLISAEEMEQRRGAQNVRMQEIASIMNDPAQRAKYNSKQIKDMMDEVKPSYSTHLNPNNALAQQASALGNIYGFKETKKDGDKVKLTMYQEGKRDARQASSQAFQERMSDKKAARDKEAADLAHERELEKIELKASYAGEGKGKGKASATNVPSVTTGGKTQMPVADWTDPIRTANILGGREVVVPFNLGLVQSATATITDNASRVALSKQKNPDSINFVTFLNKAVKSGDSEVAQALKDNDQIKLMDIYFAKNHPKENENKSVWKKIGSAFTGMPNIGEPAMDMSRIDAAGNNNAQSREKYLSVQRNITSAVESYVAAYNKGNENIGNYATSEPNYFGINTKNPKMKALNNEINVNLADYDFYDAKNPNVKISPSEVQITNITDSYAGSPISYLGKDAKGNVVKIVPGANRLQYDLKNIANNASDLISKENLAEAQLYLGVNGENANLAAVDKFASAANEGNATMSLPTTLGKGKNIQIQKAVRPDGKIAFSISYPGGWNDYTIKHSNIIMNPKEINDPNRISTLNKILSTITQERGYNLQFGNE